MTRTLSEFNGVVVVLKEELSKFSKYGYWMDLKGMWEWVKDLFGCIVMTMILEMPSQFEAWLIPHLMAKSSWGIPLEWTCLLALKLVLERRFRESGDSPTCCELSWRPGGSVKFLFEFFRIFRLTMVVVKGREVMSLGSPSWVNSFASSRTGSGE